MKHTITICMGSSCFARGNDRNLALIESYLKKHALEADVEMEGSRCQAKCVEGPNLRIDGVEYRRVDSGSLLDLLRHHLGPAEA